MLLQVAITLFLQLTRTLTSCFSYPRKHGLSTSPLRSVTLSLSLYIARFSLSLTSLLFFGITRYLRFLFHRHTHTEKTNELAHMVKSWPAVASVSLTPLFARAQCRRQASDLRRIPTITSIVARRGVRRDAESYVSMHVLVQLHDNWQRRAGGHWPLGRRHIRSNKRGLRVR